LERSRAHNRQQGAMLAFLVAPAGQPRTAMGLRVVGWTLYDLVHPFKQRIITLLWFYRVLFPLTHHVVAATHISCIGK
jgi:hypothetical protein